MTPWRTSLMTKRTFRGRRFPKRQSVTIQGKTIQCYSFEAQILRQLDQHGVSFDYEPEAIPYTKPAKTCRYTPDIILANGIYIEVKGEFNTADRQKHNLIRQQHPELDIRFVFANARQRIGKKSKTTYAQWCEQHGFLYAERTVPKHWLGENL